MAQATIAASHSLIALPLCCRLAHHGRPRAMPPALAAAVTNAAVTRPGLTAHGESCGSGSDGEQGSSLRDHVFQQGPLGGLGIQAIPHQIAVLSQQQQQQQHVTDELRGQSHR